MATAKLRPVQYEYDLTLTDPEMRVLLTALRFVFENGEKKVGFDIEAWDHFNRLADVVDQALPWTGE